LKLKALKTQHAVHVNGKEITFFQQDKYEIQIIGEMVQIIDRYTKESDDTIGYTTIYNVIWFKQSSEVFHAAQEKVKTRRRSVSNIPASADSDNI
jgi:hypothetical protein